MGRVCKQSGTQLLYLLLPLLVAQRSTRCKTSLGTGVYSHTNMVLFRATLISHTVQASLYPSLLLHWYSRSATYAAVAPATSTKAISYGH